MSVVSIFLVIARLHVLGMRCLPEVENVTNFYSGLPYFGANIEMLLIIFAIAVLLTQCEFSPGTFLLFSLFAHYSDLVDLEWGLVTLLLENAIVEIVRRSAQQQKPTENKAKRD